MTRDQLHERLRALGYITQDQQATALGTSQPNVSRYLSGIRPVPSWCDRLVPLLEADPPAILSGTMRIALARASGPGEAVPEPADGDVPAHMSGTDWSEVYGAMVVMDVVEYQDGIPYITERGWNALQNGG